MAGEISDLCIQDVNKCFDVQNFNILEKKGNTIFS